MKEVTSREKVLKNIREALATGVQPPFGETDRNAGLFKKENNDIPEILFAKEFKELGGKFAYCADEKEFCQQLSSVMNAYSLQRLFCNDKYIAEILGKHNITYVSDVKILESSDCSITRCEYLISRTGTIMVSAENTSLRSVYFTSPFHFILAYTSQIVEDVSDAIKKIDSKKENIPRFISFITGPSRTADIEKTLVMGAHGPKEIILFLIDDLA